MVVFTWAEVLGSPNPGSTTEVSCLMLSNFPCSTINMSSIIRETQNKQGLVGLDQRCLCLNLPHAGGRPLWLKPNRRIIWHWNEEVPPSASRPGSHVEGEGGDFRVRLLS